MAVAIRPVLFSRPETPGLVTASLFSAVLMLGRLSQQVGGKLFSIAISEFLSFLHSPDSNSVAASAGKDDIDIFKNACLSDNDLRSS